MAASSCLSPISSDLHRISNQKSAVYPIQAISIDNKEDSLSKQLPYYSLACTCSLDDPGSFVALKFELYQAYTQKSQQNPVIANGK